MGTKDRKRREGPKFSDLPDAVAPTNEKPATASLSAGAPTGGNSAWSVPDMATPSFASVRKRFDSKARRVVREEYEELVDDDDDAPRPPRKKSPPPSYVWPIAVAAIFISIISLMVALADDSVPLCSEQPEWNQYNCRAG